MIWHRSNLGLIFTLHTNEYREEFNLIFKYVVYSLDKDIYISNLFKLYVVPLLIITVKAFSG